MYKLIVYYEDSIVTYFISKHRESLQFVRDAIEKENRKLKINYWFTIVRI